MKVSVVVPVWNTRKYLKRCLDSLVNQTLKDIEIIVINDGSEQNVDDIINLYKDKIVYIENTNHGIGYTRNLGIKKAKGEYIGFVDSDDYVDTKMYLDYYNYAKKNNLDIVVGNYKKYVVENDIKEIKVKSFDTGNIYNNKEILIKMDYGPCTKIFRRDIIIKNNILFEEKLKYEDFPFVAKALKYSNRVGYIDKFYYYYNFHDSNESNTYDKKSFDIFKIFDQVNDIFKEDKQLEKEIEYLNVSKLLDYNIQQRNQNNSKLRNDFIDTSFNYVNTNFPNYKQNKYWKKENILKRIMKQSKLLTKMYCTIYAKLRKIC